VRPRECHQVDQREAAPLEHLREVIEVHVRVGELAINVALPGDEAVSAPELDGPVGTFGL
jgi:hypothetical protein